MNTDEKIQQRVIISIAVKMAHEDMKYEAAEFTTEFKERVQKYIKTLKEIYKEEENAKN